MRLAQSQSLLQSIDGGKLDVAEALGSVVHLVFDNADAGHFAAGEEILDVILRDFEREVAHVGSVWGLVGEREFFTDGVSGQTAGAVCDEVVTVSGLFESTEGGR